MVFGGGVLGNKGGRKYTGNFSAFYKSLSSLNHQDFDKVISLSRIREEGNQEERFCQREQIISE